MVSAIWVERGGNSATVEAAMLAMAEHRLAVHAQQRFNNSFAIWGPFEDIKMAACAAEDLSLPNGTSEGWLRITNLVEYQQYSCPEAYAVMFQETTGLKPAVITGCHNVGEVEFVGNLLHGSAIALAEKHNWYCSLLDEDDLLGWV